MYIFIAVTLALMFGAFLGFLACAMLSCGKMADLESEIAYQKKINKALDKRLGEVLNENKLF